MEEADFLFGFCLDFFPDLLVQSALVYPAAEMLSEKV